MAPDLGTGATRASAMRKAIERFITWREYITHTPGCQIIARNDPSIH